jgi:hypothetical protein
MKKIFAAGIALAAFATSALAAEFYIVRESSGKCMVVDKKPADTKVVIVGGNGKVYTTRADAEKEVAVVCK